MVGIIDFVLRTVIFIVIVLFLIWFTKRSIFLIRLFKLGKEIDAKITVQRCPYRPMWRASEVADIKIEILNTVYLVRIYSGGGSAHSVHFANANFSTVYMRLLKSQRSPSGSGASSLAMSSGMNLSAKVIYLPEIKIPEELKDSGKNVVPVLILNPAPSVLSYVSDEKTSIKIAFTGDDMYGVKVFTGSTFLRYVDRMKREEERLSRERLLREALAREKAECDTAKKSN